jgi:hypothetical protein
MNAERLEKLLDAYFDQAVTPPELKELEYELLSSATARNLFWERSRFHALLRRHGKEHRGTRLAGAQVEEEYAQPVEASPHAEPATGARPWAFIAELVNAVGVEWGSLNPISHGKALSAGLLKFAKGIVELQFYRGARMVIEGPAVLELISDMEVCCHLGKLRAAVPPPAHGFKIRTPGLQLIDLGTEFAMDVGTEGQAEVHVFDGKVTMSSTATAIAASQYELVEGEAARFLQGGAMRNIAITGDAFISISEVRRRAEAEMARRYLAWQEARSRIIADPSLLVYYDFEGLTSVYEPLPNRSCRAAPESDGTIIGCQVTEGRWPNKRALEFKQFGDRIRLELSGNPTALTCLAWVRLDGLDHRWNALLMSGQARVGEIQWQFEQPGQVKLGKRTVEGWGWYHVENCATPRVINHEQLGLWMQVAVTYDVASRAVTHYLNGETVGSGILDAPHPIELGPLEIGNWTPQVGQPMEQIRNFNGRIDEFAIMGRVLSADEIKQHFEVGRVL